MKAEMKKEYYLGLDLGTNSVGWAVTNEKYELIRVKGKDFWGIREFEAAEGAVERRTKRISRRRLQREKARIGILKSYFEEEIVKVDPLFYVRLDNSKYFPEDKDPRLTTLNGIFADENYSDREYFEEYPTIFHLRKALIEDTVRHDEKYARLVFLALLNMFKHRGHFLDTSLSGEGKTAAIHDIYPEFVRCAKETVEVYFLPEAGEDIEHILAERSLSASKKAEEIGKICSFDGETKDEVKIRKLLIKALCGLKVDLRYVFVELEEVEEKVELCFKDSDFEDKEEEYVNVIGSANYELIAIMKRMYDAGALVNILRGHDYLSMARCEEYEKHRMDLKKLKQVYKEYKTEDEYNQMFRMSEPGSYSAYVKSVNSDKFNSNGKPDRRNGELRSRADLYANIKKDLKGIEDDRVTEILEQIANETFLPKQLTRGNGIIPNQVHKREMKAILDHAVNYLPFLNEIDESGLKTAERILQLFSFQIPYYIGPTTNRSAENGGNGWIVRKEPGQILPWNIREKIDFEKTNEEFILKLIRKCTYMSDERVLPKSSLEYEAFCVLNEINNLRVDGERIGVQLKQEIYQELFCKGKKVTKKQLCDLLRNRGIITDATQISGIDININNSLSSYGKFHSIFGDFMEKDSYRKRIEEIIKIVTIYGDAKKELKRRLENDFSDILDEKMMKRILGFRFKDWGRFSKKLLELQGCEKSTGEVRSLIRTMWETNYNFMELINSDKFTFKEELENQVHQKELLLSEIRAEDLNEFYFSAPVKRMVWQTILLMKEITRIMGCNPKKIFIEMTRSDDDKKGDEGRKDSRSKQLIALYRKIKDETRDWEKEIEEKGNSGILNSKKMYLYYMQKGRCMYTGEPIDLDDLFMQNSKYDIDHIYPRHFVKDDNISNNLVLVNKQSNAYKSDNYPLSTMPSEVYKMWEELHRENFINDEKYHRLTSRNEFSEDQRADFIARQLVETSQGTKGIADLLKQMMPSDETTIVYAKARNVSDFRRDYKLLKSRIVNEFHHAQDAYLNIVVGNVYYTKFTQDPKHFIQKEWRKDPKKNNYHLDKMFERDVVRDGKIAWIAQTDDKPGTIATVQKMMSKNTPLMTRMSYEAHGGITKKETIYSAKVAKADMYFPQKTKSDPKMCDVTKYGGISNVASSYFFLVEHTKKKKRVRTIEVVPVYMVKVVEKDDNELIRYCVEKLKLVDPDIRLKKIAINSLLMRNGYRMYITGKHNVYYHYVDNAMNLCLDQNNINYIKKIEKSVEQNYIAKEITEVKNKAFYDLIQDKHTYGIYAKSPKSMTGIMDRGKGEFASLSVFKQCQVLLELLKLTRIGKNTADLTSIGGIKQSGILEINKTISEDNHLYLISQSVTGIYEEVKDLLTV